MFVSNVTAKISISAMMETGSGMGTLWKYSPEIRSIIPMARNISEDSPVSLERLTVFDINKVLLPEGHTLSSTDEYVKIEADVEHLSYGIMRASNVKIIRTCVR